LLGSVFEDLNADGQRNGLDAGVEGVWVYLDANNNGTREESEAATRTNAFGAYSFAGVAPGQVFVRIEIASPLVQTTPAAGASHVVNLTGSSTISSLNFGILDLAVNDFGDLPQSYERRADGSLDPAHHKKSKYWLGSSVDGELSPYQSPDAGGDNQHESDDENGIVFVEPIVAGGTARIQVTASTYTTYLQGWIDWNNDGDFFDDGERVVTDQLLVAGDNFVTIAVPESIAANNVFARFRMGEFSTHPTTGEKRNTNTPFGFGGVGEVEDYLLPVADTGGSIGVGIPGDSDQDEDVDGRDFLNWQRNLGKSTGADRSEGDADADGDVDADDLGDWQSNFGGTGSSAVAGGLQATTAARMCSPVDASGASWSLSTEMSSQIGTTGVTQEQSSRPALERVAGRLANLADRLEALDGDRAERAAERLSSIAEKLADRFDGLDLSSLRRDLAIDALFGAADGGAEFEELAGDLIEGSVSDAAFAELGGQFGRRRR
ncbi:MAG TPA: GEVED domain-containing protein, partial [Lacipirellula sp.]